MDGLVIGPHTIPEQELVEIFSTSGGPGGQHSNRSETAVRLRFDITESTLPEEVRATLRSKLGEVVEVVSSESRSQFRNRALARQRLREKLEGALVEPPKRRKTRPSSGAKKKRVDEKKARGETKRLRRNPSPDD